MRRPCLVVAVDRRSLRLHSAWCRRERARCIAAIRPFSLSFIRNAPAETGAEAAYMVELWAVSSPDRFFVDGPKAWLTFEGPKGKAPSLLRIELNGDEAVARRLPD